MSLHSPYKTMLLDTVQDLKRALAENDQDHVKILFDRLEKQIINRNRGYV